MKFTIPSRSKPDNLVLRVLTARNENISLYINARRSLSGASSGLPDRDLAFTKSSLSRTGNSRLKERRSDGQ